MAVAGPAGHVRAIVIDPAAGLHRPTDAVGDPDSATADLIADLRATMAAHAGMGLAAPQIGVPLCVAVVKVGAVEILLIDPAMERQRGQQAGWEGCLSLPDRVAWVARPAEVVVRTLDLQGQSRRVRVTGLPARAVVHEVDHLHGRLYADGLPPGGLIDTRLHPTPPPGPAH